MVHAFPRPIAHPARGRLTRSVRTLLTLTILGAVACDRAEQLAAPESVASTSSAIIDGIATAAGGSDALAGATFRIALRSNPSLCLDLTGSPATAGVRTKIAACDPNSVSQRFAVSVTAREVRSAAGLCLSILPKQISNGAIGLLTCTPAGRSHWTLNSANGRFQGPEKGCMTVAGTTAQAGALEFFGTCGSHPSWSQSFAWSTTPGTPGTPPPPPPVGPPATISVSPASLNLAVGSTQQLTAAAADANGKPVPGLTFTYSLTTSGAAASVSATGLVTANAAGKDTVRVAVGSLSLPVGVTVSAVAPPPPPPPGPNPPPPPPPSGLKAIDPTLPLDSVRVLWPIRTGQLWTVNAGDNLQNVLNQAQRGDEIVIASGAVFTGNFTLPKKTGTAANGWILVRSSNMAGLPPAGARATARFASAMPKLITPNVNAALATVPSASGWYVAGIEMSLASPPQYIHYGLVTLGNGGSSQNSLAVVPTDIVLDRVYIHGIPTVSLQRCVALNSAHTAIVNSTLSQCAAKGFDSQAIGGWNGPGPYRIENNYLEGAGENVMFGGADPKIANLIPSDITIRRNHFFKPLSWRGVFTVKNLLESKNSRRVLVENNIFENNWIDGQTGFAIGLKSTNQSGTAPWSQTSDYTVRYNIIRHSPAAFSIAANPEAAPATPAARIKLEHNLIYDVGTFLGTTNGRMVQLMQKLNDVQVVNNTLVHNGIAGQFILIVDKGPAQRLIIRDNVSTWGGPWGAVMGLAPQGTQALAAYAPSSYVFDRNVVAGLPLNLMFGYPTSSFYALTIAGVGFVNPAIYDFRLSPSSPYAGRSTTNGDPGADAATVLSRTASVIVP
ncbi:MAG: ricin-type beta-trefoil lectin domain protein [Gemmatimonadaceae bacterium]